MSLNNTYTTQNILINSNSKNSNFDLNNDLYIRFPNTLYIKDIAYLSLVEFNLDSEIAIFGNSNSNLGIGYTDNNGNDQYTEIEIDFTTLTLTNDEDLVVFLTNNLNAIPLINYSTQFNITQDHITSIITNNEPEIDVSTTSFTITSTNPISFYFNVKNSIGPLLGFGTGIYLNKTILTGATTRSIDSYLSIISINDSATNLSSNPNYDDLNCKMLLYNSAGNLITNLDNPGDATISLNILQQKKYNDIGSFLCDVEYEMNRYKTQFTPTANFSVTYNYDTDKITIENLTGAKFGIGFKFSTELGLYTTGSIHRILGLSADTYKNLVSITSQYHSRSFMNIFSDDFVFICSDIINNNDTAVIGITDNDNIYGSNVLFALRYNYNLVFSPNQAENYKIALRGSQIMDNLKNRKYNNSNPCLINFYLRTLSGRHISSVSSWSMQLKLEY